MITRKWFPVLGVLLFTINLFAQRQFTVDLDLRSRFEYRHGFGTLFPDGVDPAAFVTNRARLALGYKHERFAFIRVNMGQNRLKIARDAARNSDVVGR